MTSELKKYWIGVALMCGGSACIVLLVLYTAIQIPTPGPFSKILGMPILVCLVTACVVLVWGMILWESNEAEAKNFQTWRKLGLGGHKTFPRTKIEREALRSWVEKRLRDADETRKYQFNLRDARKKDFEEFVVAFPNMLVGPDELVYARAELAKAEQECQHLRNNFTEASEWAEKLHWRYLAMWDLFKAMGMLPLGSDGKPLSDPDVLCKMPITNTSSTSSSGSGAEPEAHIGGHTFRL